ncbi:outer membrane beta-barrel protein [Bacteroidota bacterium]
MFRLIFLLFFIPFISTGQTLTLNGVIYGEEGEALPYATAVLLDPADSTLRFFGISNYNGEFEIKDVKQGQYLLQIAFLGFETYYKPLNVSSAMNNDLGGIVMKKRVVDLKGFEIVDEHIPIIIKPDTIEFNTAAFKTKPDAVVEDLLKKLPGIEVDRAGNIKAMGEDVREVLVDGKEFFGNDPKVATKNLPADALSKVQVFDKTSEESDFTGIDDGVRDKSLNLVLQDDKKNGAFGDVMAGYGTGNHYQANSKLYRFSDKSQIAALGMINNINQFGFSFGDYLNFSGGVGSLMDGSGMLSVGGENGFPVNFGQAVTGLTTSGAGGINLSFSKSKHKRVFFSYLMNGYKKELDEHIKTWNYTPQGEYFQDEISNETQRNNSHRANFGWRNRLDSTQNIILNTNFNYTNNSLPANSRTKSLYNDTIINTLDRRSENTSDNLFARLKATYQNKINSKKTVLKISGNGSLSKSTEKLDFVNNTEYYFPPSVLMENQYQNDKEWQQKYFLSTSVTQKLWKKIYIEPMIKGGQTFSKLERKQGLPAPSETIFDSLSPNFSQDHNWMKPEIAFSRNTKKVKLSFSVGLQYGNIQNSLNSDNLFSKNYTAILPRFSWEYDYKTGKRISFQYFSNVNTPTLRQSLDVVDNINPLIMIYGNRELKPEHSNSVHINWMYFDQFSFTSLFASISGNYTKDKINWSRDINPQLVQKIKTVNVKDDYDLSASIDYSTPIRKLGIKIRANLRESYNRGRSIINKVENINTRISHKLSLSFDNRKKEKWDLVTGAKAELSNSQYSVQDAMNNRYFDLSWFADIRYNPNESWNFEVSADITNYSSENFDDPMTVPLIGAEITYYFLKNKRGALVLQGYDLLNKNTGIFRSSDINYQMERKTNIIGRYVMLSFKYRLNKFAKKDSITIDMDHR